MERPRGVTRHNERMTPGSADVLRYAAFTDAGRGGNPAGVVLDATGLGEEEMLRIAADVGFSETAFVVREGTEQARIRYFSPQAEVAFCGHATIATAVALADREGPGTFLLTTQAGPVTVRTATDTSSGGTTATLVSPPTRSAPADEATVERALRALRWSTADLDPRYPVHVAHAGNDHLVVGAASLDRLADFDYDYDQLADLMREQGWTTVHAFWAEAADLFHARDAFPPGGVVEDPATGAAAAAFGGYLRALRGPDAPRRFTILQGHHMGAPSRLVVDLERGTDTSAVSGTATPIAGPAGAHG